MGRQSHPVVTNLRGGIVSFARNCSTWPFECIGAGPGVENKDHSALIAPLRSNRGTGWQWISTTLRRRRPPPSVPRDRALLSSSSSFFFYFLFFHRRFPIYFVFHGRAAWAWRRPVRRLTAISYENFISERRGVAAATEGGGRTGIGEK